MDYVAIARFEKMKKKNVVPVFWGPKMETTSKYDLDPVGPPKNGKRINIKTLSIKTFVMIHRTFVQSFRV